MSTFRYVALIWDVTNVDHVHAAQLITTRLLGKSPDWKMPVDCAGMRVLCASVKTGANEANILVGRRGVVLGSVFERPQNSGDAVPRRAQFDEAQSERIIARGGKALISDYWGRYVAFLISPKLQCKWVLKDPMGGLACFTVMFRGVRIFFSELSDCLGMGLLQFRVNWDYFGHRVAFGSGPDALTALQGVDQLYGGQCMQFIGGTCTVESYWVPATVATSEPIEDPHRAAIALRSTLKACTNAWAASYRSILHRLSGGLDSSIVACCLGDAPARPQLACVTYYFPNGDSDERPYARLAAQHAGARHIEKAREVTGVSFQDLLRAAPQVNPISGSFAYLELDRIERELAHACNADAFCSGDLGDTVFGAKTRLFGAADYVRLHGVRRELFAIASNLAQHSNFSAWKILSRALQKYLRGEGFDPTNVILNHRRLVTDSVRSALSHPSAFCPHPWTRGISRAVPGVARFALNLALSGNPYDGLSRPGVSEPDHIFPLYSQPLVELCLRIPSFVLNENGVDRGLARRAFVKDVPQEILARRWKGRAPRHVETILGLNREFLRQLLLDGILVKERFLDPSRLENALLDGPAGGNVYALEVFDYALVETWLSQWTDQQRERTKAA